MQVITTTDAMRKYSQTARQENKTIGFVPTMGYLHDGHLSLIRAARKECDVVVVSIFVNPAQFGPREDFDKYPRDIERDKFLAGKEEVDVVFIPSAGEIYPEGYSTYVEVTGRLTESLCGASRPGHFRGVTTIVAKLFNIVAPHRSYFGQKDAQQVAVIKRMVRDLDISVEIRTMPVVRESDGLAMSSRNVYLSGDARQQAQALFRSLECAKEMVTEGELSSKRIKQKMKEIIREGSSVRVDYIEIVDADSLVPLEAVRDNTLIAVAAFVKGIRLIDNVVIRLQASGKGNATQSKPEQDTKS